MLPLIESTQQLRAFLQRPVEGPATDTRFPKLTVITPSYNQGVFLERTIVSVLNQGYPNLEYIIVDGGSTDSSVDVIRRYAPYISYWVSEKDNGQVDALNKGLARATGDWISFQNSDDVYFPETFFRFAEAARKYPQAGMLYGDLYMITADDEVTELLKTIPFSLTSQVIEGMQVHNQSLFFRRSLVEQYGAFDPSYGFAFDYEFITRYAAVPSVRVQRVAGLAGALRVHEEAKSSTIAHVGKAEHLRVTEQFGAILDSRVPTKLRYLYSRLRKAAYLIAERDIAYIRHRLERSRKE